MRLGTAGTGQLRCPARWELLEEGHVPVRAGDQRGELLEQVPVHLLVGLAAPGAAPEVALVGAHLQLRLGWPVPAVEQVPCHSSQLHGPSIGGSMNSPAAHLPANHFVTGEELDRPELLALLDRAEELKQGRDRGQGADALAGRSVGLVFEKPSTRTRVSFEVGVAELGATPLVLRGDEMQLTRGESIGDTGRILSRYLHGIVIRSGSDQRVRELADGSSVPVINGLTPQHHPCQALADLLTLKERFGDLDGLRLAYVGDGNNVARSLAILGGIAGVEVVVASPSGYGLNEGLAELTDDPKAAAADADAIYTDVWVSMGDEAQADRRRADLGPYQVNHELLAVASERAVALHCLPAHPDEEITSDVLYGERSAVWDQAENRLHAQKALLERLLSPAS